jgi:hypothetical protein
MSTLNLIKGKKRPLLTRGFGAEPAVPDVAYLAEWIAEHRGRTADLTSFLFEQSLAPQVDAGISIPCGGGKFVKERICNCLIGVENQKAVDELHTRTEALIEDAAAIFLQKKGSWCAFPAPHMLGITDTYYHDEEEWMNAISGAYRTMMRAMRDTGITGHVLICDAVETAELSALAKQKVFFYQPETDRESLERLLEFQQQVAVSRDRLGTLFEQRDEYEISRIIIVDADEEAVALALSYLDPDQVMAGGYCTGGCGTYWKNLAAAAFYTK